MGRSALPCNCQFSIHPCSPVRCLAGQGRAWVTEQSERGTCGPCHSQRPNTSNLTPVELLCESPAPLSPSLCHSEPGGIYVSFARTPYISGPNVGLPLSIHMIDQLPDTQLLSLQLAHPPPFLFFLTFHYQPEYNRRLRLESSSSQHLSET